MKRRGRGRSRDRKASLEWMTLGRSGPRMRCRGARFVPSSDVESAGSTPTKSSSRSSIDWPTRLSYRFARTSRRTRWTRSDSCSCRGPPRASSTLKRCATSCPYLRPLSITCGPPRPKKMHKTTLSLNNKEQPQCGACKGKVQNSLTEANLRCSQI